MDEAEYPDSKQNRAHDGEDRSDADITERRVEVSHRLLDWHRYLLQGGQAGQVIGDHLSHGGSFASDCSAVREHHNGHRDEPSGGHVPTLSRTHQRSGTAHRREPVADSQHRASVPGSTVVDAELWPMR